MKLAQSLGAAGEGAAFVALEAQELAHELCWIASLAGGVEGCPDLSHVPQESALGSHAPLRRE